MVANCHRRDFCCSGSWLLRLLFAKKICVILSLERFVLEKNSFNGKTEYPYNIYRRNNRHD